MSSSSDLALWAKELYKYNFISEDTRKEMQKGVAAKTGRNHQYGLGLQNAQRQTGELVMDIALVSWLLIGRRILPGC